MVQNIITQYYTYIAASKGQGTAHLKFQYLSKRNHLTPRNHNPSWIKQWMNYPQFFVISKMTALSTVPGTSSLDKNNLSRIYVHICLLNLNRCPRNSHEDECITRTCVKRTQIIRQPSGDYNMKRKSLSIYMSWYSGGQWFIRKSMCELQPNKFLMYCYPSDGSIVGGITWSPEAIDMESWAI